jgi:hypothetical protein
MLRFAWLVVALVPVNAWGQLYLIAGTPTPKWIPNYAATLVRVDQDGSAKPISELVSKEDGIDWLAINYELKTAVIVTRSDALVVVIDLDKAAVTKSCKLPASNALEEYWLANVPGKGPLFGWDVFRRPTPETIEIEAYEMLLDADLDCEHSFVGPGRDHLDVNSLLAHGRSGVGDLSTGDGIGIVVDKDLKLDLPTMKTREHLASPPLPSDLSGIAKSGGIIVRNQSMLVVGVGDGEANRTLLLRKGDPGWRTVPAPNAICLCRDFGRFIAMTEVREKKAVAEQRRLHPGMINVDDHVMEDEQSAGGAEWRRRETNNGPNQEESFKNSTSVFPGRLHLYNIETERLDTIVTNQGDSEILLVENNTVYYRVTDRLYSAPITDEGIGAAALIAKDDLIRDSHWAFIKH